MDNSVYCLGNRSGEVIYTSNDPQQAWNGLKNSTGQPSPQEIYLYEVHYVNLRQEPV